MRPSGSDHAEDAASVRPPPPRLVLLLRRVRCRSLENSLPASVTLPWPDAPGSPWIRIASHLNAQHGGFRACSDMTNSDKSARTGSRRSPSGLPSYERSAPFCSRRRRGGSRCPARAARGAGGGGGRMAGDGFVFSSRTASCDWWARRRRRTSRRWGTIPCARGSSAKPSPRAITSVGWPRAFDEGERSGVVWLDLRLDAVERARRKRGGNPPPWPSS